MKYTRLIIVERAVQVSALSKYNNKQTVFLSLTPETDLELTRKEFHYVNTLDFFKEKDHSFVVNRSHKILELIRSVYDISDDFVINESCKATSIFYLRSVIINYTLLMASIINNAFDYFKPLEIILATTDESYIYDNIAGHDNFLQEIVEQYCSYKDVKFRRVDYSDSKKKTTDIRSGQIKLLLHSFVFELQMLIFKLLYKKRKAVIGISTAYNMDRLVKEVADKIQNSVPLYITVSKKYIKNNILDLITGRKFFFLFIPNRFLFKKSKIEKRYQDFTNECRMVISKNTGLFCINGINLGESILKYFDDALFNEVKKIEYYNHFISRLLSSANIVTAFAPHCVGINAVLGANSKKYNIPAFIVSHGTLTKQNNDSKREMQEHSQSLIGDLFPYIAAQTKKQLDFLKDAGVDDSRVVNTGSLIYANIHMHNIENIKKRLYGKDNVDKKIILHTGTPSMTRFFEPFIFETQHEYVSNINDIIASLSEIFSVHLVVKIRTKHFPNMSVADIKSLFIDSNNSDIYMDGIFEEYLSTANLLVSYSSTTIEEALSMKVPVLQYDPNRSYQHIDGHVLCDHNYKVSPIYSVLDKKNLKCSLQFIINNHINLNNEDKLNWSEFSFNKNINKIINKFSRIQ
jgi:hypothetical protein